MAFPLNRAIIQAISSSLIPTIGERITAASGISCIGLSITARRLKIVSTSVVSKYPLWDWAKAGMPSSISPFTKGSAQPARLLSRITISPYLALLYRSSSLSQIRRPWSGSVSLKISRTTSFTSISRLVRSLASSSRPESSRLPVSTKMSSVP